MRGASRPGRSIATKGIQRMRKNSKGKKMTRKFNFSALARGALKEITPFGTIQPCPGLFKIQSVSNHTWYPIWWLSYYAISVSHFSSVYIFSPGCLFQFHTLDCQLSGNDLQIFISCPNLSLDYRLYLKDNGTSSPGCPRSTSNSACEKFS